MNIMKEKNYTSSIASHKPKIAIVYMFHSLLNLNNLHTAHMFLTSPFDY